MIVTTCWIINYQLSTIISYESLIKFHKKVNPNRPWRAEKPDVQNENNNHRTNERPRYVNTHQKFANPEHAKHQKSRQNIRNEHRAVVKTRFQNISLLAMRTIVGHIKWTTKGKCRRIIQITRLAPGTFVCQNWIDFWTFCHLSEKWKVKNEKYRRVGFVNFKNLRILTPSV